MSFFKASVKKEDIASGGNSKYINKSGAYAVNLIAAFASAGRNGGTSIDLFVDNEGQQQTIYGNLRIANNNGERNEIGSKTFNQLLVTNGIEEVSDPVDAELPIGKKGANKDAAVLEDLTDLDIVVRIQQEYGVWNNNITEKQVIRGFYRAADFASAEEIVNNSEFGVQYENDSKFFNDVTYNDGLDSDSVQDWIAAKRPKGTASGSSSEAPKKPAFGKKKSFGAAK